MTIYLRDGRAPAPKSELISRIMSRVRGKNTKPELSLRKELRAQGFNEYCLHPKTLPGRPDVYFPSKRLAVFISGCFWHRCHYCKPSMPKTHKAFWAKKFAANVARDKAKRTLLKEKGIRSVVFWECQIKKNVANLVAKLKTTAF
jgi:DNA mismatch endonuclease (patch repair protein)